MALTRRGLLEHIGAVGGAGAAYLAMEALGLAIPTPGGIGGFHKACQLVLTRFYAFSIDSSVAVAVLFHLIGTLPVLTTGLFLFAREGLRWKDVKPDE